MQPPKIKTYKMVTAPATEIEAKINDLIAKGWQPFGSPVVLPPTPDLAEQVDTAFQAMVKYGSTEI